MDEDKSSYISTSLVYDAITFYRSLGYQMIDVPMCVSDAAIKATIPINTDCLKKDENQYYVGSAEQSFIDMYMRKLLSDGKYMALTPCHRYENRIDPLHFQIFLKLELIDVGSDKRSLIHDAYDFFHRSGINVIKQKTSDGEDLLLNNIEIGSYGQRHMFDGKPYLYGTGLAEPRTSFAMRQK